MNGFIYSKTEKHDKTYQRRSAVPYGGRARYGCGSTTGSSGAISPDLHKLYETTEQDIELFRTLQHTRIRLDAWLDDPQRIDMTAIRPFDPTVQIAIGYIDTELELLARYGGQPKPSVPRIRWTGTLVELVELIYGLQEMRCINDGEASINELIALFSSRFGLEINVRNCYDAYLDMKRRKNDSRTYFLDKMRERLNLRMQRDDEKERERRK